MRRHPLRLSDGIAGVRIREMGHGLPAVALGDAARKPMPPKPDRQMDVECWCHRTTVRVFGTQLALGRTHSCDPLRCGPPPGFQEAQRHCVDCDDWFTPASPAQHRCVPCNAVKHMG